MADIRINALATTATSTASDDYIAIDGSANGTRKLSAYSPTFGGNLTVSGTATLGPTNPFKFDTNLMQSTASGFNGALVRSAVSTVGNPTFSNVDDTDTGIYFPAANTLAITTGGTQRLSVDATATTLSGNLTVSGTGTSSFASGSKLGVGTTSPGVTFVAVGAPATLNYTIGSTSLADIRSTSAATTNDGPSLTFSGYYQTSLNTSTYGAIKGVLLGAGDGNSAAGALTFLTANVGGVLSEQARLTNLGNLLIGTTTDSGNGKLQLATHTTSAGGIGFGTDTSLYRTASGSLAVYGSGSDIRINFSHSTSTANKGFDVQLDTSKDAYVWQRENRNLYFGTNNTTALTLDSSQNATFAGTIKPQQAATASAPTYVKGAIYFDTTLNKLRVGGATGWETITSV